MEELTKNDLFWIRSSLIKRRDNLKKDIYIKSYDEIEKIRYLINKIDLLLKDIYKECEE